MLAMIFLRSVEQGLRPSRPCCDPAGGGTGWLHRLRSKRSGEPGGENNLSREECAERSDKAGEIVFAGRLQP